VTVRYGDVFKKVVAADKSNRAVEFDAITMLPGMGSLQSLKIAVALMHRGESTDGTPEYDYRGRLLVGEHVIWPSNLINCIDMDNPLDGECTKIIIF
jgi:hypothetical protein